MTPSPKNSNMNILDYLDYSSIWIPAPISEEPEIILMNWRIMLVSSPLWEGKTFHFVGSEKGFGPGRVSSKIETFDKDKMTGKTESGRVYGLIGKPGRNSDADYVWRRWVSMNMLSEWNPIDIDTLVGEVS